MIDEPNLNNYRGHGFPSCTNDWSEWLLVDASPLPVENNRFPKTNAGVALSGPTPCTDGATLWIPMRGFVSTASFLFHEMAHAYLHYPNGPDADLTDPMPRNQSVWEFEACLAATQIMRRLGLPDCYNAAFMRTWQGEYGDVRLERVAEIVNRIVRHYQEALIERWGIEYDVSLRRAASRSTILDLANPSR